VAAAGDSAALTLAAAVAAVTGEALISGGSGAAARCDGAHATRQLSDTQSLRTLLTVMLASREHKSLTAAASLDPLKRPRASAAPGGVRARERVRAREGFQAGQRRSRAGAGLGLGLVGGRGNGGDVDDGPCGRGSECRRHAADDTNPACAASLWGFLVSRSSSRSRVAKPPATVLEKPADRIRSEPEYPRRAAVTPQRRARAAADPTPAPLVAQRRSPRRARSSLCLPPKTLTQRICVRPNPRRFQARSPSRSAAPYPDPGPTTNQS